MEQVRTLSQRDERITPQVVVRVAVLQRVCRYHRLGLFRKISTMPGYKLRLFLGEDIPDSKAQSASDLSGIDSKKLPTCFIRFDGRVLTYHKGLVKALEAFEPDVVLCEGESNFLNYLQALWYRRRHRNVALIHWSLGALPGAPLRPRSLIARFKYSFRKNFDAFVTYSSFGKRCLVKLGHPADRIVVATNVADTSEHLEKADRAKESSSEARVRLGLPERFTVLYAGAMDANKRPDLLLDLANATAPEHYNYVLLGAGSMLEELHTRAESEGLTNVFLPGRVSDELPLYYRAADVMVLPGRGGMVISEAMSWSLPVIVHQADGTEYDLLRDGETGLRLAAGDLKEFAEAIENLRRNPEQVKDYGANGRQILEEFFTRDKMVEQLLKAIHLARHRRAGTQKKIQREVAR